MPPQAPRPAVVLGAMLLALSSVHAADPVPPPPAPSPITIQGDLRLRYEWDWDSQNGSGVPRADRDRARVRARIGATYQIPGGWSLSARLRTGDRRSQQSPHLTFSASDDVTDDFAVQADRYFVQYKEGPLTVWGGRNGIPFWQSNEIVWDDDVTPTGIAVSYEAKCAAGTITTAAGSFYLPDGMLHLHGNLAGAQVKFTRPLPTGSLTAAAGLHRFTGEEGARYLRNRNGARDYLVGVLDLQWTRPLTPRVPLVLAAELIRNFENYDTRDVAPLGARHADETNGYVFSATVGQLKQRGDVQAGYAYAHIETLAVNASFSQDDWARFGSGPQSDVTDFKGHELRATVVLAKNLTLAARCFFVEAITSIQDGKRCRVDLNWKF